MKFPREFFEGEEREGFYIEPMMKRAWASELEILSMIDAVCEKYNIKYFALWGTLLGAVRHKGYVPWDDDIDIAMLREDYERFFEVAPSEFPNTFKFITIYSEPEWDVGVGRVTNNDRIIISGEELKRYHGCPYSLGVDIFPYDYIPDDEATLSYQTQMISLIKMVAKGVGLCRDENNIVHPELFDESVIQGLSFLENSFGFQFNREVHLINQLVCLHDQVYSSLATNSRYVTCYTEKEKREEKGQLDFKFPAKWVEEVVSVPFENIQIKVPKYFESVLKACYGGTYMTPVKTGVSGHDYPCYHSQISFMEERGLDKLYEKSMETYVEEYAEDEYKNPIDSFTHFDNCVASMNISDKKSILYCVSSMDVYRAEEMLVKKIKNTFKYFKALQNDIEIYVAFDPLIYDLLEWKSQTLAREYMRIIDGYSKEQCFEYINYVDAMAYVDVVDGYYGSMAPCIKSFQIKNKPIMVHNLELANS